MRKYVLVGVALLCPEGDSTIVWVRYDPPLKVFPFARLERHSVQFGGKASLVFMEPCCDMYTHHVSTTRALR